MKTTRTLHVLHSLIGCLLVFAGCTGCGQKTAPHAQTDITPSAADAPVPQQHADGGTLPTTENDVTSPETDPNYNPYYGKSYFLITENNLKPPPPDEFYADPLFWVPGWDIRTEYFFDPHTDERYGESFLVLPESLARDAHREKLQSALRKEQDTPLTEDQRRKIGEILFAADGLSHLHVAKYFALLGGIKTALMYAQKAHEENPDDFHTLFLLAHLQGRHPDEATYEPLAAANFRRLIAINPNVARLHYEYARVLPSGDYKLTYDHLDISVKLDPTLFHGEALLNLAAGRGSQNEAQGREYLQQHAALFPSEQAARQEILEGIQRWTQYRRQQASKKASKSPRKKGATH